MQRRLIWIEPVVIVAGTVGFVVLREPRKGDLGRLSFCRFCDKCHERNATCHITTIVDGVAQTSDLCERCSDATASPDVRELTEATRTARCQYCGGSPCSGGTDFVALMTGVRKLKFMCMPCTQEYHRCTQQAFQRVRSGLSQQEQLAAMQTVCEEVDRHMKQWVSARDSQ